jgi:dihydrolipoamide dehydrogenase
MYDLIILGGGPAGGAAAEAAKKAGMSVLLIEKRHLGGVCLNEGCIPSKFLLCCSKRFRYAQDSVSFGTTADNVRFDIRKVIDRKNDLVGKLRKSSESSKKKLGIEVVGSEGAILPKQGDIFRVKAGSAEYESKRLLLCSGSEAIRLPIPGADQPFVCTNREVLDISSIPRQMVIIGGGIIGLEFATFFSEIGSKVTVIEMLPSIAGTIDPDIRAILQKNLEKKGVVFKLQSKVSAIADHAVQFTSPTGAAESAPADIGLMSVGRKPSTSGLGLENIGVELEKGAVKTDEQGRTTAANVFAAGDINGKLMLAHTASREAEVCVDTMMGKQNKIRYDTIPSVVYTHPEVAWVGLTEEEARMKGYEVGLAKIPLNYSGRYFVETENGRDIIKVVVDRRYGALLGVHMSGGECSEMIHGAAIIIEAELGAEEIRNIVFPHPTIAEIMKDAICTALG